MANVDLAGNGGGDDSGAAFLEEENRGNHGIRKRFERRNMLAKIGQQRGLFSKRRGGDGKLWNCRLSNIDHRGARAGCGVFNLRSHT